MRTLAVADSGLGRSGDRLSPVITAVKVLAGLSIAILAITRLPVLRPHVSLGVFGVATNSLSLLSTALLVLRALFVRRHRFTWTMLAIGSCFSTSATIYLWAVTHGTTSLPFPSLADAGWLMFYPTAYIGIIALIRDQLVRPRTRALLDGAIAGFGIAALFSVLAIDVLIKQGNMASSLGDAVAIAYPIGDALLLGLVLCLFTGGVWVIRGNLGMLSAGLFTFAIADMVYISLASRNQYIPGDLIDVVYTAAVMLIGIAAWHKERRPAVPKGGESRPLSYPIAFALSSLAILFLGSRMHLSIIPVMFAALTLVTVALRTVVSFHQITNISLHDSLTGLPNRALVLDRIEQMFIRNRQQGTVGAALYVDLDGFKNVNDTLGHEAGDQLLQAVASRLTASLRDVDTIGRVGGDEFVVLIDGASVRIEPELVAERLIAVMREPFKLDCAASPIVVTTSVGIATGDREIVSDLLRDADVALYEAKASGRNRFMLFRPEMHDDLQHRNELELDLRSALKNQEFRLFYQPIYDLDDLSLTSAEALIRWQHPRLGLVLPDEFIPLLESSGQIIEVGRWVLVEACRQMKTWSDAGADLSVAVNVSGRQLDSDGILDDVTQALALSGLDPASLNLEVTETTLMRNVESTARRLGQLKALGVKLSIDDFGTGYSSLAYVQQFPVDCLKIDRAFTNRIAQTPESDAIIHTLVQLGRNLGLKTLAEGVETVGQMDHLRAEAVDQIQGFLLSRPLNSVDFQNLLTTVPEKADLPARQNGRPRT